MKYFTKNRQPETRLGRRKKLLELKTPICDHREGMVGDDVTLYYPGFQRFIDQCNDITLIPTKEECTLIQHMCTYMSKYMPVGRTRLNTKGETTNVQPETIRQDIFMKLMNQFLENPIVTNDDEVKQFYENDTRFVQNGMMEKGGGRLDGYIDPCKCVILEVKNESGQGGGSDSYEQVIAYYVKTLEVKQVGRCPAPVFLLELVGPHLFISGAVYGRYVFIDKLIDPVWLVPQHNEDAIIRIARIFKALKEAIRKIRQYYWNVPVSQPRFPIFQSFYKGNIQYKEAIKPYMFKGNLTYYNGTRKDVVIVTFVKQYSREAHELMNFYGYAPKLIHYEERVGGTQYTAIVMKYIPDARPLDEFLEYEAEHNRNNEIKKLACTRCTEALKVMHDNGFCHGKILSKSILGKKVQNGDVKIFIVNYKWAGRQGEATYPLSADIPEGFQPGDLITRDQDKEQLEELLPDDNESEDGDEKSDE